MFSGIHSLFKIRKMKKIIFSLFLSVMASLVGCSTDDDTPAKTHELVKEELDVSYGDHPLQNMDILFPEDYDKNTPVVFLIHGGGFMAGTKDDFAEVAKLFVTHGFVAVNLNHRLVESEGMNQEPPVHQTSEVKVRDQVEDMAEAVKKFESLSKSYGLSNSKMYMAGHSAGGTLAMLYVQGTKNKNVRASGNFAGLTNMTLTEEIYNDPYQNEYWPIVKEALYRFSGSEVSPETALSLMAISPNWVSNENKPGKPNITVMAKSNDQDLHIEPYFQTLKDAQKYHKELKSYGTNSAYQEMDTDHGFGNDPEDWPKAVSYAVEFFNKN